MDDVRVVAIAVARCLEISSGPKEQRARCLINREQVIVWTIAAQAVGQGIIGIRIGGEGSVAGRCAVFTGRAGITRNPRGHFVDVNQGDADSLGCGLVAVRGSDFDAVDVVVVSVFWIFIIWGVFKAKTA